MGVVNEHHMGFYTNYTIPAGANVGQALYTDNYSVCSIQGFVTRDLTPGKMKFIILKVIEIKGICLF